MPPDIHASSKIEELVLERVMFYISHTIDTNSIHLNDPKIRIQELAYTAEEIAVTLTAWLLGNKFPDRSEYETVSYPDGPWETFKERYAPQWFLVRWPVKMKEIRVESARYHYNICPHANIDFGPNSGRNVHLAFMAERPEWGARY